MEVQQVCERKPRGDPPLKKVYVQCGRLKKKGRIGLGKGNKLMEARRMMK
jgi:hypothetical protein